MKPFDTFAMVDWSGGRDTGPRPRKDAIWAAVVRDGAAEAPVCLRNRAVAEDWIAARVQTELAAGRRLCLGVDIPFGYPAGFARVLTGADGPRALWDWYARHLDPARDGADRFALAGRINARFPGVGPFWFNGGATDIPDLPRQDTRAGHGMAERRLAEARVPGAFTVWQLGGAGAVGGQTMTGMTALSRLCAAFPDIAVWPFDAWAEAPVAVVEIWPSLLADAVRAVEADHAARDAAQVAVVAATLARMQADGTLAGALDAAEGPDLAEEGWILGVGAEAAMRSAARAATAPAPPRLSDDCFALPAGVTWTPVDDALARLRSALHPVTATEEAAVPGARGRVLARDAVARRSHPPAANAAVDGYGFAHGALSGGAAVLPLAPGRAAAGAPFAGTVPPGHALRILTGAPLPPGVDSVVLEEDCRVAAGQVAFHPPKPGANTRKAGEDVAEGAVALSAGHVLRPMDLGLLTALGVDRVMVRARLRVGVLSTGDELLEPGAEARPGLIHDANRPMLLTLLDRWDHATTDLGIAADDRDAVRRALNDAAARCNAILTSGGASAGDEDHISALLRAEGRVESWRIALKPGRPLMLGLWRGVPVFGMPGNPVAAFVCALIFARPALSVLAGAGWLEARGFDIPAAFAKSKKPGRREYLRARLTPEGRAEVFASEGSGRISGLSWADGLVELGDAGRDIAPGDPVRYLPYAAFGL